LAASRAPLRKACAPERGRRAGSGPGAAWRVARRL